jgi:hypothetical protein
VLSNLPEVSAHPRCNGASMGLRKGLLCGSCVIHMKLQACIGADTKQVVHQQQLNKLRDVSLLGILQECGELGRMMPWGHLVPGKA